MWRRLSGYAAQQKIVLPPAQATARVYLQAVMTTRHKDYGRLGVGWRKVNKALGHARAAGDIDYGCGCLCLYYASHRDHGQQTRVYQPEGGDSA